MQCARCNVHSAQRQVSRVRLNKAKLWSSAKLQYLKPATPDRTVADSWYDANGDSADTVPGSFMQNYKSVLFICAVSGAFSATALIYLSYSLMYLGIVAVPFLTLFTAGLLLSIGLPLKLRREHAVITRG
jgi:hypothetical protein